MGKGPDGGVGKCYKNSVGRFSWLYLLKKMKMILDRVYERHWDILGSQGRS